MKYIEGETKIKVPIFCPDCRRSNTFIRQKEKDIRSINGKVIEEAYCCLYCGYIVYSNSCLGMWSS